MLRGLREERGLSIRSTAERAGISAAHLSEVERGRKELSLSRMAALARALELPVGDVFLAVAAALGAAPAPRPRHPLGFAPDPRDQLAWVADRLPDPDLRSVAAFGAFLAAQHPRGAPRP